MITKEIERIPPSFFDAGVSTTEDDLIIRKSSLLYICTGNCNIQCAAS